MHKYKSNRFNFDHTKNIQKLEKNKINSKKNIVIPLNPKISRINDYTRIKIYDYKNPILAINIIKYLTHY